MYNHLMQCTNRKQKVIKWYFPINGTGFLSWGDQVLESVFAEDRTTTTPLEAGITRLWLADEVFL